MTLSDGIVKIKNSMSKFFHPLMFKNINSRWFLIAVLLLFVCYRLWPSYQYFTLSDKDKEKMQNENPLQLKDLSKKSINLGLDLQGGMHVVLEADVPNLVKKLAFWT